MKNHNFFFFFVFLFFIIQENAYSVDDSDILIDHVFMTAIKKSNYQKVEEMIDKDAAINYKDSKGLVGLAYALENDDKRMFKLLIDNGADPRVKVLNRTSLLIYYISMNRYSLIEDMILSGMDIDFQDKLGMTALMHAIEKANVNAVNILVRKEFNKQITDLSGKTIFEYSKLSRNILIKKLVESLETLN